LDINPYDSAIGKVTPGTFVPDISPAQPPSVPLEDQSGETAGASFKDTVKSMLDGVNDKMLTANQLSEDYASGKTNDYESTVKGVEEAGLAFQFTMAIRNKLMEAYTEIQQQQF
jgi:flagellar hook-basal body complex protein FliE